MLNAQFYVNDDADSLGNNCYQLTTDNLNKKGTIWSGTQINLNNRFDFSAKLYFGSRKVQHGTGQISSGCGADGIVFALQRNSTTVGGWGWGIGYAGITPSLGVEFDTFRNSIYNNQNDPTFDHIAILKNGNTDHALAGNLAGPVQASPTSNNIKDSTEHWVRFTWDPNTKILKVYFDCQLRLTYNGDIVNDIFSGDPMVYWGFTSATGGCSNFHRVCFQNLPTEIVVNNDGPACVGESVQLSVTGGAGLTYTWTGPNGFSSTEQNPVIPKIAKEGMGVYTVVVGNATGCALYEAQTEVMQDTMVGYVGYIPNVFTPNGDDKNDYFKIDAITSDFSLTIYNRWGQEMYKTNDVEKSWDGTKDGEKVPDGVYYYIVRFMKCNGDIIDEPGFVTLISSR